MAVLRRVAMTCGPESVRSWWRSSSKTTSRTQCRAFSMDQCPWIQVATVAGGAAIMSWEQIAYTISVVLWPSRVRVRRTWTTWAALGKSSQVEAVTLLTVRRIRRPWLVLTVEAVGDLGPRQALELGTQPRLVALDGQHVVPSTLVM